jgi:hypothetical protein
MEFEPHERARFLIDEARIAGIGSQDEQWLRSHVAGCPACTRYESQAEAVVRGLRSFAFEVDPEMNRRVEDAVVAHVRKPSRTLWWAGAAAAFLAVVAVPVYQGLREARLEEADAILMERVEKGVWRVVPVAMEPLLPPHPEETK